MHQITWEQLKNSVNEPLADGDRIQVVERKIESSGFEVMLELDPAVTLWKSVTLVSGEVVDGIADIWLGRVELYQSLRGPVSFWIDESQLAMSGLFLGKDHPDWSYRPRNPNDYHVPEIPGLGLRVALKWLAD